jgi:hypothetical protein
VRTIVARCSTESRGFPGGMWTTAMPSRSKCSRLRAYWGGRVPVGEAAQVVRRARNSLLFRQRSNFLDGGSLLYAFGSYAGGALEPHDVDIAVDLHRDERMRQPEIASIFSSRNPTAAGTPSAAGRP